MSVNSEGPAPHFQHRLHPQPQPRPSWESELPPTGGTTTTKQINKNKSGFYLHTWLRCVAEWKTWGEQEWSPAGRRGHSWETWSHLTPGTWESPASFLSQKPQRHPAQPLMIWRKVSTISAALMSSRREKKVTCHATMPTGSRQVPQVLG